MVIIYIMSIIFIKYRVYYQLFYKYYEYGSLFSILNKFYNPKTCYLSEIVCIKLFLGIIEGIKRIHEIGFCHRDIKPNNILIDKLEDGSYIPIIIDLGSCRPREFNVDNKKFALEIQEDAEKNCTAPYRPPELFNVPENIYRIFY